MRILQVNKFHWLKGGAERYYFDLQAELASRGHDVAVFSMRHRLNEPSRWESHFVPETDYDRGGVSRALDLARNVIWNDDAARRLENLLDRFRPDVAHLHNFHHQLSPSILKSLAARHIPVVQTLHDYKWVCPAYLFLSHGEICERCGPGNRFHPVLLRRCQHGSLARSAVVYLESSRSWKRRDYEQVRRFLAPSRFMAARVIAHGLPADRVLHVPYFIRESEYRPAPDVGNDLLYIGRLSHEKGLTVLFDALSMAVEQVRPAATSASAPARHEGLAGVSSRLHQGSGSLPPGTRAIRLRVAGSGPLENELRARVERENLPVTFLGHLRGNDLHEAIRQARAVVVPSRWYENLPYAILEAFALGVPVIGSDVGGIPELIEPDVTGRLVAVDDAAGLADAMAAMLDDPQAARRMGRAARQRIETEFSAGPAIVRLESLYRDLAKPAAMEPFS